jgi:hypothetical protein
VSDRVLVLTLIDTSICAGTRAAIPISSARQSAWIDYESRRSIRGKPTSVSLGKSTPHLGHWLGPYFGTDSINGNAHLPS